MTPQTKLSQADDRPNKFRKPKTATDPDALRLDLADMVAGAHATADDRVVALGLDLAPLTGYAYALIKPGKSFDPKADFAALGQLDLRGGDWDSGPAVFVRLRAFLQVIKPAVVFYRELPVRPAAALGRTGAVAVTAGKQADDAIRHGLRETLADWASRCSVPCRAFEVGALKKTFLGRGVATKADLVGACNDRFGVALDLEGCDVTGVDRVALAALGLLAGLQDLAASKPRKPG